MITPSFGLTATERVLPRLALDFTTANLDPRITFTRALNTATRVNSSGLIETVNADLPRFDYDPITKVCKGLLIEESRANGVLYSQDISNAAWSVVGVNRTGTPAYVDVATSPDGTQNADKLTEDTSNGTHYTTQSYTASNTVLTFSVFLKAAERSMAVIQISNNATGAAAVRVDLLNGTIPTGAVNGGDFTNSTASIVNYGNGWYRCILITTKGTLNTNAFPTINLHNRVSASYQGDGTSGLYVWGMQMEVGAFPTSYIPTTTTSLTRNADVATMTGTNFSSWYNTSAGSLYAEAMQPVLFASSRVAASFTDGTNNTRITLYRQSAGSINGIIFPTGAVWSSTGVSATANVVWKQIIGFTTSAAAYAVNGVLGTDSLYTVPLSSLNRLTIGSASNVTTDAFNGYVRKIMYYPQKLTNAELIAFSKL